MLSFFGVADEADAPHTLKSSSRICARPILGLIASGGAFVSSFAHLSLRSLVRRIVMQESASKNISQR